MSGETNFSLVDIRNWNVSKVTFSALKPLKNGLSSSARIYYEGKSFYLRFPKMSTPFGIQLVNIDKEKDKKDQSNEDKKDKQTNEIPKWSLQASFKQGEPDPDNMLEKCVAFDDCVVTHACNPENVTQWTQIPVATIIKQKDLESKKDIVSTKYKPMVKYQTDKKTGVVVDKYPPFIRVGVPTQFGKPNVFNCSIYDKSGQELHPSTDPESDQFISKLVPNMSESSMIITPSVWANTSGFGVTWKLVQLKVYPSNRQLPKKCLLQEDPSDQPEESSEGSSNQTNDPSEDPSCDGFEMQQEPETTPVVTTSPVAAPAAPSVQVGIKPIIKLK